MTNVCVPGNPIVCSCQSFRQKLWLTQNRKWIDRSRQPGSSVGPQCQAPDSLHQRYLLTTKDAELCPLPSVSSFDIGNVTTDSVLITWDSKNSNMTGLKGFLVAYHRLDTNDMVKKYQVGPGVKMFRLTDLKDDSVYLVCVITQGSSYSDNYPGSVGADNYLFSEAIRLDETGVGTSAPDTAQYTLVSGDDLDTGPRSTLVIPSSNDTRYLITRPVILNLDSQSSRCNKIKTPLDPSKLNMVDNKQLSALIGCSSGLMIFFCIIISIVARPKKHKEEDVPVPTRANSLTESYKSPSFKSRSDSLVYDKSSYLNSGSSSLTRLNGVDHEVRIRKDSCTAGAASARLSKNMSSESRSGTLQPHHQLRQKSSAKHNNSLSRQSSSDASHGAGAIRKTGVNTRSRRHTGGGGDLHHQDQYHQKQGGDTSRSSRRSSHRRGYEVNSVAEDCIPMIEYTNSNHSSPQQTLHVPRLPRPGGRTSDVEDNRIIQHRNQDSSSVSPASHHR